MRELRRQRGARREQGALDGRGQPLGLFQDRQRRWRAGVAARERRGQGAGAKAEEELAPADAQSGRPYQTVASSSLGLLDPIAPRDHRAHIVDRAREHDHHEMHDDEQNEIGREQEVRGARRLPPAEEGQSARGKPHPSPATS